MVKIDGHHYIYTSVKKMRCHIRVGLRARGGIQDSPITMGYSTKICKSKTIVNGLYRKKKDFRSTTDRRDEIPSYEYESICKSSISLFEQSHHDDVTAQLQHTQKKNVTVQIHTTPAAASCQLSSVDRGRACH